MSNPEPNPDFRTLMTEAQVEFTSGKPSQAGTDYSAAQEVAPDNISYAMSLRGEAASELKQGNLDLATNLAQTAYYIHGEAAIHAAEEEESRALREYYQSGSVLGRTMLFGAITDELEVGLTDEVIDNGVKSLDMLANTHMGLFLQPQMDQYLINNIGPFAIASSLYRASGRESTDLSQMAWRLGWQSESKKLNTSADISTSYMLKAKGRAVVRGAAALMINELATDPVLKNGRTLALKTAKKAIQ